MKTLISFKYENGETVYDSDGQPMCETIDHVQYGGHLDIRSCIIHHHSAGSNASTTSRRFINGKSVYDSSGRAIFDTFHYERWD